MVIIFGQLFGLLPINRINANNPKELKFKWFSFKFFYSLSLTIISSFELVMFSHYIYTHGYNFGFLWDFFYYLFSIFAKIHLTIYAEQWKSLMVLKSEYENIFLYEKN